MTLAFFRRIGIVEGENVLALRLQGAGSWSIVPIECGTYENLEELFAAIQSELSLEGYQLDLEKGSGPSGARSVFRNDTPFELSIVSFSLAGILGFPQGLHSPPSTEWIGEDFGGHIFIAEALKSDTGWVDQVNAPLAISLEQSSDPMRLSSCPIRRIGLSALLPDACHHLGEFWRICSMTQEPFRMETNWHPVISEKAAGRMPSVIFDTESQPEFQPKRTWSAPQPERYDIDLHFARHP